MIRSFIISNLSEADHMNIPPVAIRLYLTRKNTSYLISEQATYVENVLKGMEYVDGALNTFTYRQEAAIAHIVAELGKIFGCAILNEEALKEIQGLWCPKVDTFLDAAKVYRIMTSARAFDKYNATIAMLVMSRLVYLGGSGGVLYLNGGIVESTGRIEYLSGMSVKTTSTYVDKLCSIGVEYLDAIHIVEGYDILTDADLGHAIIRSCRFGRVRDYYSVFLSVQGIFDDVEYTDVDRKTRIHKVLENNGAGEYSPAYALLDFVVDKYGSKF